MYCTSCNDSLHSTEIYFCKDMPYCQYCSPWRKEYVSIIPKTCVFLIVLYNKYELIDINITIIKRDLFKSL